MFNDLHRREFTEDDRIRLDQVQSKVTLDDEIAEILRKNPEDIARSAFEDAVFDGLVHHFVHDREVKSILMSDENIRKVVIDHYYELALRESRKASLNLL